MADNQELAALLARVKPPEPDTLAKVLGAPGGFWDTWVRPMGSEALAQQKPNALGQVLTQMPPEAMLMANFLGPKVPRIPNPIRAYHGSPHDFDKFDASKIGTGEGNQSYGHGLYFAEHPETARSYRDNLSMRSAAMRAAEEGRLAEFEQQLARQRQEAEALKGWNRKTALEQVAYDEADLARIKALPPEQINSKGRMYEVALHAPPEAFLDWDKPLHQQSEGVRKALAENAPPYILQGEPTGQDMFQTLTRGKTNNPDNARQSARASEWMQGYGIPGIRYKDQLSRGTEGGTSNYVVFPGNESLIEILKKYGIAGLMGAGGAAALNQPDQQ